MALQALSSQVQKLVADQVSSHQQVQQMYASQAAVQRQMQALLAQLQNPTPPTIPTMQVVPPSTQTSPVPPQASQRCLSLGHLNLRCLSRLQPHKCRLAPRAPQELAWHTVIGLCCW